MAVNPSRILGINKGTLGIGKAADIIIFDPEKEWKVEAAKMQSKSKNTPFEGEILYGKPEYVIVGGKVLVNQGELM